MPLKVLHSETLTEFSERASPVENCGRGLIHVQETPHPAYDKIMSLWDQMEANPTYEAGKEALELWMSGKFSALEEGYVGPEDFSLKSPMKRGHALEDFLIAYVKRNRTKLRIWNGVERKVGDASMVFGILSSRFQSQPTDEPRCLSVFGMKATEKGILDCGPMLLQSTGSDGISHKIVCQ